MPKLDKRLTDSVALKLPLPHTGTAYYWCKDTPGFGLRVSATGDRAYIFERRVEGKTVRRTLGKAAGAKAISASAARDLKIEISGELQKGADRLEAKREKAKAEKEEGITLALALAQYVKGKRRGKDGLALKPNTIADYESMVAKGKLSRSGKPYGDGPLYPLADKPLTKITADDMRRVYVDTEARGKRRAVYAMQVLRAVLNWHGVAVEGSPLSKQTAGKDRIILAATTGKPTPIAPEKLGAWWAAATTRAAEVRPGLEGAGNVGADGYKLMLLTGCRPGEIFGSQFEPGLRVRDVDLVAGKFTLLDTKNRRNHTVMLSTQALDILRQHCADKAPDDKVFNVIVPRNTLIAINKAAGVVGVTPHKLRHTFASVAEELVSGYALKRMMNHADGADVTGNNYVGKSENQLRVAWQTVADFICSAKTL
jgi:integrase